MEILSGSQDSIETGIEAMLTGQDLFQECELINRSIIVEFVDF